MTLIANLRHAARNHETVTIGGGEFGPAELAAAADLLEAAPFLETALRGLLSMPEYDGTPDTSRLRRSRKDAAKTALDLVRKQVPA